MRRKPKPLPLGTYSFTDFWGGEHVVSQPPSRTVLERYLAVELKNISLGALARALTNPVRSAYEYYELMMGKDTCQLMSLLFNPHRLDTISGWSKTSVYRALNGIGSKTYINGLARASLFQYGKSSDLFYNVIRVNVNNVQYCDEFPPHIARNLYRDAGLDRRSKILDPCGGWGGRMIGASVVCDHYDCYEPATLTANGLKKLASKLYEMTGSFEGRVSTLPFEDARLRPSFYDFALTSPPYYDTEKYTDEPNNSANRYKTFDDWCAGFYLPMIDSTMDALKPDKFFVLNIGSRKYPLNERLREHAKEKHYEVSYLSQDGSGRFHKRKMNLSATTGLGKGKVGEGEAFYMVKKR